MSGSAPAALKRCAVPVAPDEVMAIAVPSSALARLVASWIGTRLLYRRLQPISDSLSEVLARLAERLALSRAPAVFLETIGHVDVDPLHRVVFRPVHDQDVLEALVREDGAVRHKDGRRRLGESHADPGEQANR